MQQLLGRYKHINTLQNLKASNKSEFVAVLGRRRVGKTFLVRQVYKDDMLFQLTGLANAPLKWQLDNVQNALTKYDPQFTKVKSGFTWFDAFEAIMLLTEKSKQHKKIIFLDELPWLDTPNSGFLIALEHFWNSWASARTDIVLVVCGSAAAWMIKKLLNNKGGLHNRITKRVILEPFNLAETKLFLQSKGAVYEHFHIAQLYMALGGVPYYLDLIATNKSAAQNINDLFFSTDAELRGEYHALYDSLFKKSHDHKAIVEALATKAIGLSREEIIKLAKLQDGGGTSIMLTELEQCGFIRKYQNFGKSKRDQLYQLVDFFSLFYLKFVHHNFMQDTGQWLFSIDSPQIKAWSGYAFEMLCLHHINAIKLKLGIAGVQANVSSWYGATKTKKAQIDLLIDRKDGIINICEMKFSINDYTITKKYADDLLGKISVFKQASNTRKTIMLTMVTAFGLTNNLYSSTLVQNNIVLNDLFKEDL
jgi:uncharacterized protein